MEGAKMTIQENGPPEVEGDSSPAPYGNGSPPQAENSCSNGEPSIISSSSPTVGDTNGSITTSNYTTLVDLNESDSSSPPVEKVDNGLISVSNGHVVVQHDTLTACKDDLETHNKTKPSPEDNVLSVTHHRRCVSVDHVAKASASPTAPAAAPADNSTKSTKVSTNKVQIDTRAPFESVKAAVSKFGGIVDWKAHRVLTVERRKFIEQELEKAQDEMPSYKEQCRFAEEAKMQVLKELESTKRLIEELKLNLERAQTEEQQAKQDSELAKLRVEEMEQGIADEASYAAKAQLEVARARHAAAVSELKSVKDELQQLRTDYALLIAEKEAAEAKAEEALSTSKNIEKSVENLTIELITLKQSLDSEHSAHLEAEEHRIGAVMARDQDSLNWEMELKQAEEELDKLKQQMLSAKELKSKLSEATTMLHDLKAELATYMESESTETGKQGALLEKQTRGDIVAAINATKKELVDVKLKIEKATDEVNILKVTSTSLKSELEKENMQLESIQQREGMASTAITSLEMELNRIKSEMALVHMKEKEEREKMSHLPIQIEEAAREADEAKAIAQLAREELSKAKQDLEQTKEAASTAESKLRAVQREIEAAKASEKLALAAINAVKERREESDDDPTNGITLSLEEYYELSKRAHEAEEQAKTRVEAVMSQIELAKESEIKSSNKLEEVGLEMSHRKDALQTALQKAEEATQGKLNVENELRKRKAPHNATADQSVLSPTQNTTRTSSDESSSPTLHQRSSPRSHTTDAVTEEASHEPTKAAKKKKKSFFPRIFMFLGRRKTHATSKTD